MQVQESIGQVSQSVSHTVTSWAAAAAKQANVKGALAVQPTSAPQQTHKTLAHAISRAAATGAVELGAPTSGIVGVPPAGAAAGQQQQQTSVATAGAQESKLGQALQKLALAQDQVGNARLKQDDEIINTFYHPWASFGNQIGLANK